jgi:GTPase
LGLTELKDLLWEEINKEENRVMTISHRSIEVRPSDVEEEIEEEEYEEEDEEEDFGGIGWDEQ